MAVSESEATFTPMESPDWLQNIPGDYFSQLKSQGPQSYYNSWEDIRGAGNNYISMLNQLGPTMVEATRGAAGNAQNTYDTLLNRALYGQSMIPEYSADSGYMKNFLNMVASPEDYSSFIADQDYYDQYLQQLLGNSIELGYGDQSISFIPGSSAEAAADVMQSMMQTQSDAAKAYGGEKVADAAAYPSVLGDLIGAEYKTLEQIIPGYTDKSYQYEMDPYNAYFGYTILPYQQSFDLATQYPADSWWQNYMADYYNQWSPFELARFYQQPSYQIDSGNSAMDYLSSILGLAGGAYNLFGGSSGLSSIYDTVSDWFGGNSNGVGDYLSTSDYIPSSSVYDAYNSYNDSWLDSGLGDYSSYFSY